MKKDEFVQRVYVVVETGWNGNLFRMVVLDREPIPDEDHYRDEKAVADATKRLMDRFKKGGSYASINVQGSLDDGFPDEAKR